MGWLGPSGAGGARTATAITFTAPGTGAVPRPSSDKLGEVVSVKDFDAKGDGVTDDLPAFKKAITAVLMAGGGTVLVPPGVYLVTDSIFMRTGVTMMGAGVASKIKCPTAGWTVSGTSLNFGIITLCDCSDITIDHLWIEGTWGGYTPASAADSANSGAGSVPKLISGGQGREEGSGPYTGGDYSGSLKNIKLSRLTLTQCLVEAIWLSLGSAEEINGITMSHCYAEGCGLPAYFSGLPVFQCPGRDIVVTNNTAVDCGSLVGNGGSVNVITGNIIRNPYAGGIASGDSQQDIGEGDWAVGNNIVVVDIADRPIFKQAILLGGGAAAIAGNQRPFVVFGNVISITNDDETKIPKGIIVKNINSAVLDGNTIGLYGHGYVVQCVSQSFGCLVRSRGNSFFHSDQPNGAAAIGIIANYNQNGGAFRFYSDNDEFFGFDAGISEYAVQIQASNGATINGRIRNLLTDISAYVRLGDAIVTTTADIDFSQSVNVNLIVGESGGEKVRQVRLSAYRQKTLASDTLTLGGTSSNTPDMATSISVAGEGGAADDLSTISGGADGDILHLKRASSTITVKSGVGNISMDGGDYALSSAVKRLTLRRDGSTWYRIAG